MGGLRVLPQPFALVLGCQAAAHRHLRRDRDRLRPGQPEARRRTRASPDDAGAPAGEPPGTRHRHRHGQGPVRRRHRSVLRSPDLGLALIRPARKDEKTPRYFPNWLRQRVEAIIWTLKNQLGLERHGGRVPAGLWARIVQRLLALNATSWHNWRIGAPVKRSLIGNDH